MSEFYTKQGDKLTPCTNIRTYGYYLAGYQCEADKGKLSTLANDPDSGATILTYVYDDKGQQICNPNFAGKYFNQIIS